MSLWIARDKDGTLAAYHEKPIRKKDRFEEAESGHHKGWADYLDDSEYPQVTWENSPKELTVKRNR